MNILKTALDKVKDEIRDFRSRHSKIIVINGIVTDIDFNQELFSAVMTDQFGHVFSDNLKFEITSLYAINKFLNVDARFIFIINSFDPHNVVSVFKFLVEDEEEDDDNYSEDGKLEDDAQEDRVIQ